MVFGQLTDIFRSSSLLMRDIPDTDRLLAELTRRFPQLGVSKYVLAVNKKTISGNTPLSDGSTVALLPPFSGG